MCHCDNSIQKAYSIKFWDFFPTQMLGPGVDDWPIFSTLYTIWLNFLFMNFPKSPGTLLITSQHLCHFNRKKYVLEHFNLRLVPSCGWVYLATIVSSYVYKDWHFREIVNICRPCSQQLLSGASLSCLFVAEDFCFVVFYCFVSAMNHFYTLADQRWRVGGGPKLKPLVAPTT